eukprot:CAMPEP_0178427760 /NCGR_PEP_ID=MMETSP0689_2-20121128/29911_1 /TAXON_ID=160604 /ORGANISM="Amphidinium massartii, Strain CS-259" /LENGTH=178 /DNA_ID=CAMNT_0020049477 /DNA_START=189 /DNA_END=725 /DNA_ORIENTATION=+
MVESPCLSDEVVGAQNISGYSPSPIWLSKQHFCRDAQDEFATDGSFNAWQVGEASDEQGELRQRLAAKIALIFQNVKALDELLTVVLKYGESRRRGVDGQAASLALGAYDRFSEGMRGGFSEELQKPYPSIELENGMTLREVMVAGLPPLAQKAAKLKGLKDQKRAPKGRDAAQCTFM